MCVFAYMSSVIMNSVIWCCSVFSWASCKSPLRKVNETTNTVSHNLHEGTTLGTTATDELATQQNYFKASNECWTQNDGTLIGSPVSSVQAEFFLQILEECYYPNKREREQKHKICTLTTSLSYVKGVPQPPKTPSTTTICTIKYKL